MLDTLILNKTKVHTRDIQLATYSHENSKIIVHGILKDLRHIKIFDITGKILEPGVIHHMDVKLLVHANPLTIEAAEATMLHVPMEECHSTLDTINQLIGIQIKSGFSKKIRMIMGGKRGCTHLCQLINTMSQEIVQGWLTQKNKERISIPTNLDKFKEKAYLIDSCQMWTQDGPKMRRLKEEIKKRS